MKKPFAILLAGMLAGASCLVVHGQTATPQGNSKKVTTGTDKQAPAKTQPVKEEKVVYTCPMHPSVTSDKPGKCPECKMNLVKKEAPAGQYTCPMHPEVAKDKPGKCPKCGMTLVKKEDKKPAVPKKT